MAVMYEFKRPDGKIIQRFYPIGQCPQTVEDEGMTCTRHYTPHYFAMHTDETPIQDAQKLHEEVRQTSADLGISEMKGLHNQSDAQKLKDLHENKSQFRDQMQKANEENREKHHRKMVEESRKRQSQITEASIKKRQEQKEKRDYESRKIVAE